MLLLSMIMTTQFNTQRVTGQRLHPFTISDVNIFSKFKSVNFTVNNCSLLKLQMAGFEPIYDT